MPGFGRVLVMALSGHREPDFWQEVRDVLRREVPERSPQYMVFDLRALDGIVGSAFVGGLVAGAVEMQALGRPGRTRIVATGEMAARLGRTLMACKLEPILGPVHPDLASALLG
jgi:hypothetical protein